MKNVWVVIDLEVLKAWIYFDERAAWKKKKARVKKYQKEFYTPKVYIRKFVLG